MSKSKRKEFSYLQTKLEVIKKQLDEKKPMPEKLSHIRFIGITFEPDSFKNGENELNDAIAKGYKIINDYPTAAGVVISMGLYKYGAL